MYCISLVYNNSTSKNAPYLCNVVRRLLAAKSTQIFNQIIVYEYRKKNNVELQGGG